MSEILFLAHRIPFPPDRGDKIRSWHVLKHLAGLARVHLACFADDAADAAHIQGLRQALGGRLGEVHVEVRRVSKPVAAARALASRKPLSLTLFDSARLRRFVADRLADPRISAVRHPYSSITSNARSKSWVISSVMTAGRIMGRGRPPKGN